MQWNEENIRNNEWTSEPNGSEKIYLLSYPYDSFQLVLVQIVCVSECLVWRDKNGGRDRFHFSYLYQIYNNRIIEFLSLAAVSVSLSQSDEAIQARQSVSQSFVRKQI